MGNSELNTQLLIVLGYYQKIAMFEDYEITSPISQGMDGDTPFHMAAYDGNSRFLRDMLPFVPDINIKGDIGNTPLHYAAMKMHSENDYGYTALDYMESEPIFNKIITHYLKK